MRLIDIITRCGTSNFMLRSYDIRKDAGSEVELLGCFDRYTVPETYYGYSIAHLGAEIVGDDPMMSVTVYDESMFGEVLSND